MKTKVLELNGRKRVIGVATEEILQTEHDAVDLIAHCGECDCQRLLLLARNLPESFFDLSSGLAGVILQKFVNYHVRVALVLARENTGGRFGDYVAEANRGNHFRVFERESDAERWLAID